MADKETPVSGDAEKTARTVEPTDNGFDPDKAKNLVERILGLHVAMEAESGRIRGEIKAVYAEGRGAGIPSALLKEAVNEIRTGVKTDKRREQLDTDYPGQYERLQQAIGDRNALTPAPAERPRDSWNPTGED